MTLKPVSLFCNLILVILLNNAGLSFRRFRLVSRTECFGESNSSEHDARMHDCEAEYWAGWGAACSWIPLPARGFSSVPRIHNWLNGVWRVTQCFRKWVRAKFSPRVRRARVWVAATCCCWTWVEDVNRCVCVCVLMCMCHCKYIFIHQWLDACVEDNSRLCACLYAFMQVYVFLSFLCVKYGSHIFMYMSIYAVYVCMYVSMFLYM